MCRIGCEKIKWCVEITEHLLYYLRTRFRKAMHPLERLELYSYLFEIQMFSR